MRGSCLCGTVRYEVDGPMGRVGHCHCTMCRKQHGAAFATYGRVATADLRWTGEEALVRYASSPEVQRWFCGRCGSSLVWARPAHPDTVELALGTLDDDPGVRPELHLFVADKAPWDTITDGLPAFDTWPRRPV